MSERKQVRFDTEFGLRCMNQININQFDGARVFFLNPSQQLPETKDFSNVAWILMEKEASKKLEGVSHAEMIAKLFVEFGDYNVMRDSKHSFFIEFYCYDKKVVPSESIDEVLAVLTKRKAEFGIAEVRNYENARKFRAF